MTASRAFVAFALALAALPALAEGPGSRLRTTPEVPPLRPAQKEAAKETMRCERLPVEVMQRCLAQARAPTAERKPSGPESTGMGSGAGAGSNSGTTGGAGFGGTAPR